MKTKLIIFYGPGSRSGKSTLSCLIHDVFQQKGVRSKYIAESDVLHLDDFRSLRRGGQAEQSGQC